MEFSRATPTAARLSTRPRPWVSCQQTYSSSRTDELADGRLICVTRQPMADGGCVATHKDITEQRRSEAKIAHMALHDAR